MTVSTHCDGLPKGAGVECGVEVYFVVYAAPNQTERCIDGRWMYVICQIHAVPFLGAFQSFPVPSHELQRSILCAQYKIEELNRTILHLFKFDGCEEVGMTKCLQLVLFSLKSMGFG